MSASDQIPLADHKPISSTLAGSQLDARYSAKQLTPPRSTVPPAQTISPLPDGQVPVTVPARPSWWTVLTVATSGTAILLALGGLVLTIDVQPGQGTLLGGAAVLVGGGLTYLGSHQKRTSDERIELRKHQQTAEQIALAEKEASRARAEFEQTLQAQLNAQIDATAREQNRELRTRFTTATNLMSSDAAAARLTGVHELAALADDWAEFQRPAERQVCIDILCAQLRAPRMSASDQRRRIEDEQFRAAIIRVIKGRTAMDPNTGDGPWQDCNFDLSDSVLPSVDLTNCRFRGELDFRRTVFDGSVNFSYSSLAFARFENAKFTKQSVFGSTSFVSRVGFEDVEFSANVSFRRAKFDGNTDFSDCIVKDAELNFTHARFNARSHTVLRSMKLTGRAILNFTSAWFLGGNVELRNLSFSSDSRIKFIRPYMLKSLPRTDWEACAAADLPNHLEPREWPPTVFMGSVNEVADEATANEDPEST